MAVAEQGKMQKWTAVRDKSGMERSKRDRNKMSEVGPKDINLDFIHQSQ